MLGERLKELRKDHNETQQQLADYLHVSVGTLRTWERNISSPDHDNLARICQKYDTSADYLLGLIDEDQEAVNQIHLLSQRHQEDIYKLTQYLLYIEKLDQISKHKARRKSAQQNIQKNGRIQTRK